MVATGPSPSVDLGMLVLPAPTVPHALPGLEWGRGEIKGTTPGGYGRDTRYSEPHIWKVWGGCEGGAKVGKLDTNATTAQTSKGYG